MGLYETGREQEIRDGKRMGIILCVGVVVASVGLWAIFWIVENF